MKEVFEATVKGAEKHGILRTAIGWGRKFKKYRQSIKCILRFPDILEQVGRAQYREISNLSTKTCMSWKKAILVMILLQSLTELPLFYLKMLMKNRIILDDYMAKQDAWLLEIFSEIGKGNVAKYGMADAFCALV